MNAHVELLSGIIRAGPECDGYGKPYDFAAAFVVDGNVATIKALTGSGLTTGHARAAIEALEKFGLTAKWDRYLSTGEKERVVMAKKEKIQNLEDAINADGTVNHGKLVSGLTHYFQQEKAGHYKATVKIESQTNLPGGGKEALIRLRREATNPSEKAE